ncbi:hypothetical protein GO986_00050 [Deinococcus sp. HMF7620]|uniref:Uncharacterized protein n=1 Tax=Deinococcus arboris TaxID=2682977 RepID=A0A7C9M5K5_9DEIO|nr:hypothetical protein [Deinococcus arboris]MVN85163.1 hypothetical protein [Deinococcus arboris]
MSRKRRPQLTIARPAKARPRPLFAGAMTLRAFGLLFEGDGRPALYLCADDHGGLPQLYRIPEDAQITVKAPRPLPEGAGRVFLPAGSAVTFQTPDGRITVLALHAVRLCREVLEALEGHAQAVKAWQAARAAFEAGEEKHQSGAA